MQILQGTRKPKETRIMRRLWILGVFAAVCGWAFSAMRADDAPAPKPDDAKKEIKSVDLKGQRIAMAKLQVRMHRTLADLIEARVADVPDEAAIGKLTVALDKIHEEIRALRPPMAGRLGPPPKPGCPWDGPGMGPRGMGRGQADGMPFGLPPRGRVPAWGDRPPPAAGPGFGPGRGPGPGIGPRPDGQRGGPVPDVHPGLDGPGGEPPAGQPPIDAPNDGWGVE
jgi:hypothetical protein